MAGTKRSNPGWAETLARRLKPEAERRDRRDHRARRSSRQAARRAAPPPSRDVPVMMRGYTYGVPSQIRRPARTRRRWDVALGVPGAEVRLPALPEINLGWRLISAAMAALIGLALYFAWNSPVFRIQQAQVEGLRRLAIEDLNPILALRDELIFAISPTELRQELETAYPEFSQVVVAVKFPNQVLVTLEERTPILRWEQDGKTVLIDANGFAFLERGQPSQEIALVVKASSPPPALSQREALEDAVPFLPVEMVSAILSLSAVVPANTPIIYDARHGLGWADGRGWQVYFGDVQDINVKMNVYTAIVKKLKKESIKPALISVEFVHAPYYRGEQ